VLGSVGLEVCFTKERETMGSFAVNRFNVNKGTGLKPGFWYFEEFYFADSVFGTATVSYDCRCRRLHGSEVAEGDLGKPYELEIVDPGVLELKVFDDDGNEITISDDDRIVLNKVVLDAFKEREHSVMEFEIGLL